MSARGFNPAGEDAWQAQVLHLLALHGWDWWYHTHDSRHSPAGWPDIVAIRRKDRRILFAELKSDRGHPTPEQAAVLELLMDVCRGGYAATRAMLPAHTAAPFLATGNARVDAFIWHPADIEHVLEVLR